MSKFVVVVFPNETKAYEGVRALKDLDAEGSLTLYGTAVLTRDAQGTLNVKQASDQGPLGMGIGALVGGLIGLIGGPVGAAVGLAGGAAVGVTGDLLGSGVNAGFVREVSDKLMPGNTAVVADVEEEWTTPLDTRMAALGETVLRQWRADFEDDYYLAQVNALKAEAAQANRDLAQASQETRAKMQARVSEVRARLDNAVAKADKWFAEQDEQADADMRALQERAARAKGDAKAAIDRRISALRDAQARRSAKLAQARGLATASRELAMESDRLTVEALKP